MALKKSYIIPGIILCAALFSHFLPNIIKPKKILSEEPAAAQLWKKYVVEIEILKCDIFQIYFLGNQHNRFNFVTL